MVMCFYKSEACEPEKYINIYQSEKQLLAGLGNKNRVEARKLTAHFPKAKDKHTTLQLPQLLAHDKIWHLLTSLHLLYVNLICCAIATFFGLQLF